MTRWCFPFAAAALTAGFLEADIIAAYDRALHKNHGRATDCQAIRDNGSTVSDARESLAKGSRRFEPGNVDPEIARQVRESLLSASVSAPAAEPNGFSRISDPCAPFHRSKTRRDSTSPREVPRGRLSALLPLAFCACQARSGRSRTGRNSRFLKLRQSFALTSKSLWLTNQNPEPSNSPSISLPIPSCDLNRLHQSMGFRTKAQTFEAILYFVSTKDKIDPAALERMEKKIDHSIHLLESLT
jgi:hypothetical protein